MKIEHLRPEEIEKRSFEIISGELREKGIRLPAEEEMITKRVIHTSADFEYADTLIYSKNGVAIAKELIINGADIVTDTNMALAGINKKILARFGGEAHCFMAEDETARLAKLRNTTRAAISMERAAEMKKPVVFVIGNAPTALIRLYELYREREWRPAFIIGVPVGFVNVEAAKELILGTDIPYIINRGRKGGSNVAAAICNAVLYSLSGEKRPLVRSPFNMESWDGYILSDEARSAGKAADMLPGHFQPGIHNSLEKKEEYRKHYGFTTGSCAAAAAKAAAYMLLTGREKTEITIMTPKGIPYAARLLDIERMENEVSCAVEKDGGDDPDITTGAWIYAKVSYGTGTHKEPQIEIEAGRGVGIVTRRGLDQPVGNAAINRVPREMIRKEVCEVCRIMDYRGPLRVEISVPEGERLAEQTFNPRLGIVGGISILGTTGIVEPMSSQAILDTILVELNQRRAEGFDYIAVSPGNYGLDFMRRTYDYDLERSVKCSNFIGKTLDMAAKLGFTKMLLTGHIGKLIKVAGGIMDTHSREADCRMELLAAFAAKEQIELEQICSILECATTEEAVEILKNGGKMTSVMKRIVERICYYMEKRVENKMKIDCILYTNECGELARSKGAEEWFTLLEREQGHRI